MPRYDVARVLARLWVPGLAPTDLAGKPLPVHAAALLPPAQLTPSLEQTLAQLKAGQVSVRASTLLFALVGAEQDRAAMLIDIEDEGDAGAGNGELQGGVGTDWEKEITESEDEEMDDGGGNSGGGGGGGGGGTTSKGTPSGAADKATTAAAKAAAAAAAVAEKAAATVAASPIATKPARKGALLLPDNVSCFQVLRIVIVVTLCDRALLHHSTLTCYVHDTTGTLQARRPPLWPARLAPALQRRLPRPRPRTTRSPARCRPDCRGAASSSTGSS